MKVSTFVWSSLQERELKSGAEAVLGGGGSAAGGVCLDPSPPLHLPAGFWFWKADWLPRAREAEPP